MGTATKGYLEFLLDAPHIAKSLGKGALYGGKFLGEVGLESAKMLGTTGKYLGIGAYKLGKGLTLAAISAPKMIGKGYHYGRKGVAAISGGMDKLKKAPTPVRAAIVLGAAYGLNKAFHNSNYVLAARDPRYRHIDMNRRGNLSFDPRYTSGINSGYNPLAPYGYDEYSDAYYSKHASDNTDDKNRETKPNIPVDTSKPSSNSPEDSADYYDYTEWSNTKGNTYPEREETEENKFDNPHKVAHALGYDVYTLSNMYNLTNSRVKTAANTGKLPETFGYLKKRLGSGFLAAATCVGVPYLLGNYYGPDLIAERGAETWLRPYQMY